MLPGNGRGRRGRGQRRLAGRGHGTAIWSTPASPDGILAVRVAGRVLDAQQRSADRARSKRRQQPAARRAGGRAALGRDRPEGSTSCISCRCHKGMDRCGPRRAAGCGSVRPRGPGSRQPASSPAAAADILDGQKRAARPRSRSAPAQTKIGSDKFSCHLLAFPVGRRQKSACGEHWSPEETLLDKSPRPGSTARRSPSAATDLA